MNNTFKYLSIIIALLFSLQNVVAQTDWKTQVKNDWQNGQISAAIELIDKQISQPKTEKELFTAYYWKGFLAVEQQTLKEAQKWFAKAQALAKENPGFSNEVSYLNAVGWYYIQSEKH